jgi:hypothetical protein
MGGKRTLADVMPLKSVKNRLWRDMPTELELDHHFWDVVSTSPEFCSWLLGCTKFAELDLALITDEKWHQRWYRDPVTKKDSETDILLVFRDVSTGDRYALHIENKPAHRAWEPLQAENYRRRALDRMTTWRYVDFQTVLLAPQSLLERCQAEAAHFDVVISYEQVMPFVPVFACEP